jgi:hypothetical protein
MLPQDFGLVWKARVEEVCQARDVSRSFWSWNRAGSLFSGFGIRRVIVVVMMFGWACEWVPLLI